MKKMTRIFGDDLGNVYAVDDGLQPGEPGGYNSAGRNGRKRWK